MLLVELGSVLIFPKSATEASLEEMGATLHKLSEMNRVAWGHGPLYQPEWLAAWKREAEKCEPPVLFFAISWRVVCS